MTVIHIPFYYSHHSSFQGELNQRWGTTIAIVSFILTVSYVPNIIWWQIEMIHTENNYPRLSMFANTVTVFNSCANPVIYALRTEAFKRALLRTLRSGGDKPIDVPD